MIKAICDAIAYLVDGPDRGGEDATHLTWAERQRPVELPYWLANGAYGPVRSQGSAFADDSMPSAIRSTP